ncbi:flavodoxin family protein [Listeria aquatica]|uniref:NADPH-dependent FMN reductase n=1 Tax=Listeria aquatica FSL S10-1188 TaxID=1265818 RepID=W7AXT9_9LIST|nr:flavodoxin family protein [Listeria aquatica]EUJ19859.1 NADPH-dependent FMN reductase [Listeria aquatica FSL S10-1188]
MKIIGILGTQNQKGLTAQLLDEVLRGAELAGAETSLIVLEETFDPTKQEEVRRLGKKLKQADCMIFATPTYFGNVSGSMKQFFDHLRDYFVHLTSKGENIPHLFKGKSYVSITSCYKGAFENTLAGITDATFNQIDTVMSQAGMHRAGEIVLTGTFQMEEVPAKKREEATALGKKTCRTGGKRRIYIETLFTAIWYACCVNTDCYGDSKGTSSSPLYSS